MSGGEWADLLGGTPGQSLFDQLDALLQLIETAPNRLTERAASGNRRRFERTAGRHDGDVRHPAAAGECRPDGRNAVQPADMAAEADTVDGVAFRGGLHETIAFVRTFLAEGAFRPLTRQESARFEALIDRLNERSPRRMKRMRTRQPEARQTVDIRRRERKPALRRRPCWRGLPGPMQASVAAVVTEAQQQSGAEAGTVQTAALKGATSTARQRPERAAADRAPADAVHRLPRRNRPIDADHAGRSTDGSANAAAETVADRSGCSPAREHRSGGTVP